MRCPVALNIIWDEHSGPPPTEALARSLSQFSPLVTQWHELPSTLWVEAAGQPIKGLSTAAFTARLIEHLKGHNWDACAVWGCSPYAAALLAQRLVNGQYLMIDKAHQHGALEGLPIQSLGLGESTDQSLIRLGLTHLRDLKRLPLHALESRYGKTLRKRLKLLKDELPNWDQVTARQDTLRPLLIEDQIDQLEPLLFLAKTELEQELKILSAQGLACVELELQAKTQSHATLSWSLRPARPSLNSESLMDLLRLKLESEQLSAPIHSALLRIRSTEARQEQLGLFKTGKRDNRQGDEALDRVRAELGEEHVFIAQRRDRHHPKETVRWVAHKGGWPAPKMAPQKTSWVRRLLAEPRRVEGPRSGRGWSLLGERVTSVGGPYPLQHKWWRTPQIEDEYLVRVQSGRVLWLLHDHQTKTWWLIGWVA